MEQQAQKIKDFINKKESKLVFKSGKQRSLYDSHKHRVFKEIDKYVDNQVDPDNFDEFFSCLTGVEEPKSNCWTEKLALEYIENRMLNTSDSIKFFDTI